MVHDRRNSHDLNERSCPRKDSRLEQTFEANITSTFIMAREDVQRTAREINTYTNKIIGLLDQLEQSHLHTQTGFQTIKEDTTMCKEKVENLSSAHSFVLSELVPCRIQVVQAGAQAAEAQLVRMKRSRKEIMKVAKRQLDEGREKQQLAADASELMKHYKALMAS